MAYLRTVKTASGASAVQIVWSSRRGSREIEHIGSAHDDAELEALKAAARQRLAAGQLELDLGPAGPGPAGPLEIASSRMGHLWDALSSRTPAPRTPGWDRRRWSSTTCPRSTSRRTGATGSASPASPRSGAWSRRSPSACSPGKDGFPLMVSAFEGNKAETKTMLPVIEKFTAAHYLCDVTVVADAGMISEANQKAIEAAGLSFILGMKIPDVPYQVARWRREHPGEEIPDGHVFTQPWPAGPSSKRRDQVIYCQYRADRARRTLRGIDEQVAKAAKAVAGLAPLKRNRFIQLDGAAKSINRELEARARSLAGLKGYITSLAACPGGTPVTSEFVIGSYHELWNTEKSFRMSKHDLRARPICHRKRDSIEAHLTIVFAALAVTRFIEGRTGWSIRKFVRTARRYRTIQIRAGRRTLTAEDPLPPDLRDALTLIK